MKQRSRVFGYLVLILLIATFMGCASTSKGTVFLAKMVDIPKIGQFVCTSFCPLE